MRGDGPVICRSTPRSGTFPPHARGWTHTRLTIVETEQVSPACAGMDPECSQCPAECPGFPRMRGDGPVQARIALRR